MSERPRPPIARREPRLSTHHGITLEDPYAWLRDPGYPSVTDPDIVAYLTAENRHFDAALAPHRPLIDELFAELKARQPETDHAVPWREHGYWYQWRFDAGAEYRTWLRAPVIGPSPPPGNDPSWTLLLDEPALAAEHAYFDLGGLAVSPDGRFLAVTLDTSGDERYLLTITDLVTGARIGDPIEDTHGAPVWFADSSHVAYLVRNAQWRPWQVRVHALDGARADQVLFEEQDDAFFVDLALSSSEQYLIISAADHVTTQAFYLSAQTPWGAPIPFSDRVEGHEYGVDHGEGRFWFLSNATHRNFALASVPESNPEQAHWQWRIAGRDDRYLTWFMRQRGHLVLGERVAGIDEVRILGDDGADYHIQLPEAGHVVGPGSNSEYDASFLRLRYESMVTPVTIYDYDLTTRTLTTRKVQAIPSGYDGSRFVTERLFVTARDGVEVPVSLVTHRDTPRDGTAPLYLYGYGAYGEAIMPGFSSSRLSLLERGFVFAIAHVRGGDDLGYAWYEAGKREHRTNTFNDFVDVARGLIARGYTAAGRIAISGGSAGGELVAAALNQDRALWGAVAAHVPFVDVLNTMLDPTLPLTPIEWPEWGNPMTDPIAFRHILSYSPYDRLEPGEYPPILVTAGLNDPRVTYWEPAKYVAKLRTLKTDDRWLLFKTEMEAGHAGQSGRFEALRELAEEYAFILLSLTFADRN
ncbi:MAG: S9 family peptidase [Pseudomonadales bacterium]